MTWYVNTDGGSRGNPGPAGYGAVIVDNDGELVMEISVFLGTATNNVAEYSAVVDALETIAAHGGDENVVVRADSKLVVEQLSGRWKIKHPEMQQLAMRAKRALPAGRVRFEWVPRAQNSAADKLANEAMDNRTTRRTGTLDAAVPEPAKEPIAGPHVVPAPAEAWDADTLF